MFLWIKHSDIIENRLEWKELETGNVPCIELGSVKHSLVVTEKNEKKSGDEEGRGVNFQAVKKVNEDYFVIAWLWGGWGWRLSGEDWKDLDISRLVDWVNGE